MRITARPTALRSAAATVALLVGLVACGSDGRLGEAASGGSSTATLTVADGTVYAFDLTTCETSNTDDFELPDSYDIFGTTTDGAFSFQLGRAGMDETFIVQVGTLEGDFDDEGKNATMLYNAQLDNEPLNVDGANVSGTFMMRAIAPTRPHGDEVEVTLDARC